MSGKTTSVKGQLLLLLLCGRNSKAFDLVWLILYTINAESLQENMTHTLQVNLVLTEL